MTIDRQLSAFVVALVLSIIGTALVRIVARWRKFYAIPVEDRWHRRPVPLLGGVAIAFACLASVMSHADVRALAPLLVCSILMLGLGIADDLWTIRPVPKLIGQMVIAGLLLSLSAPMAITGFVVVDQLIAFVWLVGITNAVNLVDNMDGLAAGISGLTALSLLALLLPYGSTPLTLAVAALAGAAIGFLFHNFPPATIFMGDSGSFFLGFLLAGTTVLALPQLAGGHVYLAIAPVLLILFVPIFDTGFVTMARRLAGRRAMVGGRDHTSHRIVALGASERAAVLFLYACAAGGGIVALALRNLDAGAAAGLVALYLLIVGTLAFVLGHVKEQPLEGAPVHTALPLVSEIAYQRRTVEIFMDLGLLALAYYAAFRIRFEEPDFSLFFPPFARSIPVVIGAQVAGLYAAGQYRSRWRNHAMPDMGTLLKGLAIGISASMMLVLVLYRFERFSRGVFLIDAFIAFFMLVGSRGLMGGIDQYLRKRRSVGVPAVIFGAGKGGALLARELLQSPELNIRPVGFVDDDPRKLHAQVEGLRVLGPADSLDAIVKAYGISQVLISIRDIEIQRLDWMVRRCRELDLTLKRMRFSVEEVRSVPSVIRHER